MTITATIIADSVSRAGARLTTLELYYPRFIHAEFMTHRMFSRNASSSRAIPVEKMIQSVIDDPAMPIHWGKNQSGMQAKEECNALIYPEPDSDAACTREQAWLMARDLAVESARAFAQAGYHKQIVNRLLEPFAHIRVVVTATEWDNFFTLRMHPDAQPEIQELARCIHQAMAESTPKLVEMGQFHLPYVTHEDIIDPQSCLRELKMISVARCARVSYRLHDGKPTTVEKDLELFNQLIESEPAHASPCEHQATPAVSEGYASRNFRGWYQYRDLLDV